MDKSLNETLLAISIHVRTMMVALREDMEQLEAISKKLDKLLLKYGKEK